MLLLLVKYEVAKVIAGDGAACQFALFLPEQIFRTWAYWTLSLNYYAAPEGREDVWEAVERAWPSSRGQVRRPDPQGGERGPHYRRGRRGACFHEARPAAPDQVPGRYACVPSHPGVDLEDIAAEVDNVTI